LYQAALIIKALLETSERIGIYPLDPTDISLLGSSDIVVNNLALGSIGQYFVYKASKGK
jgi:hypothetical protein